jgi:hypothetical protein
MGNVLDCLSMNEVRTESDRSGDPGTRFKKGKVERLRREESIEKRSSCDHEHKVSRRMLR